VNGRKVLNTKLTPTLSMTRLVLFTGKGGVGKSSTSAATAQYWARQGFRTILVSSDPAHSTEDVLGQPVGFKPTPIADNFWAANINASTEAEEFFGELQNLMQDSFSKLMPGVDADMFTDWFNFPGMDEVFALKKILNLIVGSEYDLIVFDTAPTGHTLKALTCPEAIEGFILRILRMRAKVMNLKGFMMRRTDDLNPFVEFLENTRNLMLRIRELIRNPTHVQVNLVSIPTEAGYQECQRTIKFLKGLDIDVANVVINNLVPAFDEETWELAETNKAVALLKLERDNQQPYLSRYTGVTSALGIKLCGVPKFPFEPKAERLEDFGRVVCPNLILQPHHIITRTVTEKDTTVQIKLPFLSDVKLKKDGYYLDGEHYAYPHESGLQLKRKQKSTSHITLTYK
jgi:arsenite-transporting ATPase